MISTPSDLIDVLGGNRPVATLFGVRQNTVSTWRQRGFPAWACARLRAEAQAGALRFDESLFDIKPRTRSAEAA